MKNRKLIPLLGLLSMACWAAAPAQAQCFLKQSTASQIISLGTFVDSTDGVTPETGLTIANTDIKLQKAGGTTQTNKNSGGATHIATGDYYATLDATDTNTVGPLHITVKISGAAPFQRDCYVVEEVIYDMLYGASALGYITNAPVNVAQYGGSNGTFASGRPEVNVSHFGGTAGTFASGRPEVNTSHIGGSAISQSSGVANVNVAQVSTDSGAADTLETWLDGTAGPASPLGIARQGTAQSATATTLVMDSSAAFADDTANGMTVVACGSTQGYCQSRVVTDSTLSSDTLTVDTWTVTPSGTITYFLFATAPSTGTAPSASQIATAVWQDSTAGDFTVASSIGKSLYTGNVAPGGSGGLLISGSNSGTTTLGALTVTGATTLTGAVSSTNGSNDIRVNAVAISGDSTAADNLETAFDDTAGAVRWMGIADQGTAQSATGTTLVLRSAAAFANSELVGARVLITGGSAGVGQSRLITAYTGASDTATVSAWTTTPTGTITYIVYSDTAAAGGSAPTAAEVADAVWDEATTSHTTSGTFGEQTKTDIDAILAVVDTEIAAIKAKTDSLTFTVSGQVDANTESMNAESVCGTGDSGTPWKGCP